jgi:hypothetical protein
MDTLAAELPPHPDERLSAFKHLQLEYGLGKLVPVYDVLSGLTHMSLDGAQEFFENGDGTLRLWQLPRHGVLMPCEAACLGMQFDTMAAYNELLGTRPWTAPLAAIAEDHDLPVRMAALSGLALPVKGTGRVTPAGNARTRDAALVGLLRAL